MTLPLKINATRIRKWCKKIDLSYTQIYTTLDIDPNWFNRMIMENDKYRFINPNPERMNRIWAYVKAYTTYHTAEQRRFKAFQEKWSELNN
jgi:hypothetical protein